MSDLTIEDFSGFFAALHDGRTPYAWQTEMVHRWADGTPPERIAAPTGSGKSSLIEMHVFLRALAIQNGTRHPRRLVLSVGRRALVDSQAAQARSVADALATASTGILDTVATLLRRDHVARLDDGRDAAGAARPPVAVSVVRGGMTLDDSWIRDPLGCRILCVTPDLLGSRLLFRGYLASPLSWPCHAGLLAYDTTVVVDESHLNTQLVTTLRRIRQFTSASPLATDVPPLGVIETTATPPATEVDQLTVGADAVEDPALAPRLTAAKTLRLTTVPVLPLPRAGKDRSAGIDLVVERAAALRAEADGTVGVLLNRVRDALKVAADLEAQGLRVVALVGPMRPRERRLLEQRHPMLLTPQGDAEVDVLVATQTLEVGVDLDLHGMLTELAPAPGLVQRWGRVNRQGLRPAATIEVLLPPENSALAATHPYAPEDLTAAAAWLRELGDGADVSPAALAGMRIPPASPRRLLETRLTLTQATSLSHGNETAVAVPDLEFWIADSLDPDRPMISVVGRRLPRDPVDAAALVAVTPPGTEEFYPVTIATGRGLLKELNARHADAFVLRIREQEEITAIPAADAQHALAPGDVLVFPESFPAAIHGVALEKDASEKGVSRRGPLGDVSATMPTRDGDVGYRTVLAPENTATDGPDRVLGLLQAVTDVVVQIEEERRDALHRADLRGTAVPTGLVEATWLEVRDRLTSRRRATWDDLLGAPVRSDADTTGLEPTLLLPAAAGPEGRIPWLAVAWRRTSVDAEEMQEFSPGHHPVALDDHQRDVAERARTFAARATLPDDLVEALRLAGAHHDEGKRLRAFQRDRLGWTPGDPPLAKSGDPAARTPRHRARSGLPTGWRHEQLSAVLAWELLEDRQHRELVTRLVGTSHGRGRVDFPHMGEALLCGEFPHARASAEALFDGGAWDELIARTDTDWTPWGIAYLEALLRAADTTVSEEGH